MTNTALKFEQATTELYISKPNTYGASLFIIRDYENGTMVYGWSGSSFVNPYTADKFVEENATQKRIKELYTRFKDLGYTELYFEDYKAIKGL